MLLVRRLVQVRLQAELCTVVTPIPVVKMPLGFCLGHRAGPPKPRAPRVSLRVTHTLATVRILKEFLTSKSTSRVRSINRGLLLANLSSKLTENVESKEV